MAKKLRIFDFDDTLVKTKSMVYVYDRQGNKKELTPGEFAVYKPKTGEGFDFSDFNNVNDPKQLKQITKILDRFVNAEGERNICILTARSAYKPIKDYLKDVGYTGIYVEALGDANPKKKADWIEDKIKNEGYDDVFFIDDSPKNVAAVKKLESKYPDVKFKIQQA